MSTGSLSLPVLPATIPIISVGTIDIESLLVRTQFASFATELTQRYTFPALVSIHEDPMLKTPFPELLLISSLTVGAVGALKKFTGLFNSKRRKSRPIIVASTSSLTVFLGSNYDLEKNGIVLQHQLQLSHHDDQPQ